MKRMIIRLVALLFLLGFTNAALADRPLSIPFDDEFSDLDPCTGEEMWITMSGYMFVHEHMNNSLAVIKRTGFTDSGYELLSGQVRMLYNGHIDQFSVQDIWRAEDGGMFSASVMLIFNENTGGPNIEKIDFACISEGSAS